MTWRYVKGKFVITKDGVHFALTLQQVNEMEELLKEIKDINPPDHKKEDARY